MFTSKPIDLKKAKAEIQQRKKLWNIILNKKDELAVEFGNATEGVDFYGHTGNAFLFSKQSVLRHFFDGGDLSKPTANTDLLVIASAHDIPEEGFKKCQPTIVITGVKPNAERTPEQIKNNQYEFIVSLTDEPADEYPPVTTIDDIDPPPFLEGNKQIFLIEI